jgi:hypothetical protein
MAKVKRLFFIIALVSIQSAFLNALSWSQPNGYGGPGNSGTNASHIHVQPSYYQYGPLFYRGTYCSAGGPAATDVPGAYITHMTLEFNGDVVASEGYGPDPDGTVHNSQTLSRIFASNHYPDGTALTWKLTATDNLGNTNSRTVSGTVYNKAVVYTRPSIQAAEYTPVVAAFQSMNYTVDNLSLLINGSTPPNPSENDFYISTNLATALHFSGHGAKAQGNISPPYNNLNG